MLLPKDFYKNMREKSDFIKPIPQDMNYEMNAPFPDFFDWRAIFSILSVIAIILFMHETS